jgi:hypothetical protein
MPDVETISGIWSSSYQRRNADSERTAECEIAMRDVTQNIPGPLTSETMFVVEGR